MAISPIGTAASLMYTALQPSNPSAADLVSRSNNASKIDTSNANQATNKATTQTSADPAASSNANTATESTKKPTSSADTTSRASIAGSLSLDALSSAQVTFSTLAQSVLSVGATPRGASSASGAWKSSMFDLLGQQSSFSSLSGSGVLKRLYSSDAAKTASSNASSQSVQQKALNAYLQGMSTGEAGILQAAQSLIS